MTSTNIYRALSLIDSTKNEHYIRRYAHFISSVLSSRENVKFKNSECHHIVPRCMDGTNNNDNLIHLSHREHFLAHFMLGKAFPGHPIVYAITKMNKGNKINSRLYATAKEMQSSLNRNKAGKYKTITNEISTRHVLKDSVIPEGWRLGAAPRGYSSNTGNVMITNGIENRYVTKDFDIPEGWRLGKNKGSCDGKIKIHNGIEESTINKGEEIPVGFVKGRLKKSTENTFVINDGNKERFLSNGEDIPEGWTKGRKIKGPNNGRTWVTDGTINIMLKINDIIPSGFTRGRTIKSV